MDISQVTTEQKPLINEFRPYIAVWRWLLLMALSKLWYATKQFMRNPSLVGGLCITLILTPSAAVFHILFNKFALGFRVSSIFALLAPLLIFIFMVIIYRFMMDESLKSLTMNLIFRRIVDYTFPINYYEIIESNEIASFIIIHTIKSKNNILKLFGLKQLQRFFAGTQLGRKTMFSLSRPGGHPRYWIAIRDASTEIIQEVIGRLEHETRCRTIQATVYKKTNKVISSQDEMNCHPAACHSPNNSSNSIILNESYEGKQNLFLPPTLKPRSAEQFLPEIKQQSIWMPSFVGFLVDKIKNLLFITFPVLSSYETLCAMLAIKALSSMIIYSLNEDEFGIVQKDLKFCLSSLARLSIAIDAYSRASKRTSGSKNTDNSNLHILDTELANRLNGIRDVFGAYINDLDLHPVELNVFRVLV